MIYIKIPHKIAHIIKEGNETFCGLRAFVDAKYISEKKPRGLMCAICKLESEKELRGTFDE